MEINFTCSSLNIIPSEAYILILFINAILWCHENERQTNSALLKLVEVMTLLVCESHPVSFWKEFGNWIYMVTIDLGLWAWVSAIQFTFKKYCISASHKHARSLTPISSVDTRFKHEHSITRAQQIERSVVTVDGWNFHACDHLLK
jgi:hypothetical protein